MFWMNHWKFIDPENSFVLKQDFKKRRDALGPIFYRIQYQAIG